MTIQSQQAEPGTETYMKIPKRLQPLVDEGMVDEVLYQLMSGKEEEWERQERLRDAEDED
ncbi:MAG: hypothetical protein CMG82_16760 [Marinobacter sp.]|nr:hypothetical protein [Marinobacter sp.]|tara:strand:- start:511 stop:690 length:180 start_codon:yes stop_codon:yes gene_type:complete